MKTIKVRKIAGTFSSALLPSNFTANYEGNTVSRGLIKERTGIDINGDEKPIYYNFSISFEPFEKARRVFFNSKSRNTKTAYSVVYAGLKKHGWSDFICVPWLKKLLGRVPNHKEAIYYRLDPII